MTPARPLRSSLPLLLAAGLAAGFAAACASRTEGPDPHEARISDLERENARLRRENDALKLRYEGPPATPPPAIETRCAKASGDRFRITRSGRDEILANFAGLERDVRMTPYFADGKFVGYRIHSMSPLTIGVSCGFENGDVVRAINGLPLNGPERWKAVESDLQNAKRVEFDVLRGAASRTIVVEIAP